MPNFRGAREIPYPADHARARAAAFRALPEYSPCARCGKPMWKHAVEIDRRGRKRSTLHYDHDRARTGYLGFSHAACNKQAGAAEGGRRSTNTFGHRRGRRGGIRPSMSQSAGTPGPGW